MPYHKIIPAAMRGRYTASGKTAQRLEMRPDMCTNTITSVQKDNVLIEFTESESEMQKEPVLQTPDTAYCIDANYAKGMTIASYLKKKRRQLVLDKSNVTHDIPYRVRKLTPKECWRLMGFSDQDFECAKAAMNENIYGGKDRSSSQLYKQAGNSIVVNVLEHIMKSLYDAMPYLFEDMVVGSFFSGIGAFEKALATFDIPSKSAKENRTAESTELNQIGYINNYNGDASRIYDGNAIARALKAEAGGSNAKTGWYRVKKKKKIQVSVIDP